MPGRGDAAAGDRDDVGGRAADVDQQRVGVRLGHRERRRHPVGGGDVPRPRARRRHGHELAGRRQHAQRPVAERVLGRVEHERHPLALGPERVGQLGGHRDRHGVRRTGGASAATSRSTAASASRSRQTSNGRETVRSDVAVAARRPWCSRRRCPLLACAGLMRVVGVIDLKDGTAVHAVRGERERYRPVAASSPATTATRSPSRARSGPSWGSTSSTSPTSTRSPAPASNSADASARWRARRASWSTRASASRSGRGRCWTSARTASIVGTETLTGPDALDRLLAELPDGAVVLSVDLRDGRVLSPDPQLAGLPALDAVARLHRAGLREAIVLDLARVGSGAGPDVELIAELHAAFPDLELLAGGGVRDVEDLRALATPARPARSSRPRCTAASSGRASWPSCADDRLHVRDERRRHVGAGRLLQPVPAGDPVELQHVVAPVGGAQQVDARVVDAERLGGLQAQALLLGGQLAWPRAAAPRARFARQPGPTRSIAASTRPPTTNARRSRRRAAASPAGSRRRARAPARGRRGTRRRRRPRASCRRPSSRTAA